MGYPVQSLTFYAATAAWWTSKGDKGSCSRRYLPMTNQPLLRRTTRYRRSISISLKYQKKGIGGESERNIGQAQWPGTVSFLSCLGASWKYLAILLFWTFYSPSNASTFQTLPPFSFSLQNPGKKGRGGGGATELHPSLSLQRYTHSQGSYSYTCHRQGTAARQTPSFGRKCRDEDRQPAQTSPWRTQPHPTPPRHKNWSSNQLSSQKPHYSKGKM